MKNNIYKILTSLVFSFIFALSICTVKASAASRVIYKINRVSMNSYEISLKWSNENLGNIQVTAWNKVDDNTIALYYDTFTKNDNRTVIIDTKLLNMQMTKKRPDILLKDKNNYMMTLSDLPQDEEMRCAIENLYLQGVINGYDDNSFKPYNTITKEEFCSMFFNYMNYEIDKTMTSKFYDLPNDRWCKDIVMTLNKLNVVTGQDDGNFGILKNVSLGEVSTMIARSRNLDDIPGIFNLKHLKTDNWANSYISKMVTNGLIKETDSFYTESSQNLNLTRGQVAVMLNRS